MRIVLFSGRFLRCFAVFTVIPSGGDGREAPGL